MPLAEKLPTMDPARDDLLALEAQPTPDILCRELAGESVLLDLKNQRYYGLDEVGTRIWQLLGEGGRADDIARAMLDEFEVPEPQLRSELSDFLHQLADAGLIELREPPPGAESPWRQDPPEKSPR